MVYLIALLIFLFIWALSAAIFLMIAPKDKPLEKLKYFDEDYTLKEKYEEPRENKTGPLKVLSHLIPYATFNKKRAKRLEEELAKADIKMTAEELLVIKILASSALSFLAFAVFRSYLICLISFILVWQIPMFVILNKKKERIKLFDNQLNEGIMIISNSLKSGYSFLQAVAVVAEETKDPFSKEFKKLLKEMSLGISEGEALKNLLKRMESEDLRLVINAILIQKDIGGNLSEILDNISETIRERQKIKNELKTLTAQGRLSGIIVTLLPIALGMVIYLLNRDYIMLLITTPLGNVMIAVSVVSEILGFLMIRKIVNIEM